MAHFLRYGGKRVGHDILLQCNSISDFVMGLREHMDGTCETAAMLGWELLREQIPGVKIVTIHRPLEEVIESLEAAEFPVERKELARRAEMLEAAGEAEGTLRVNYADLSDPFVCKGIFEFCLDLPFDWDWWSKFSQVNIQIDASQRLAHLLAQSAAMAGFKAEVRARLVDRRLGLAGLN
jgi:hypothetical protein